MKTKIIDFASKFKYEISAFMLLCIQACINIDFKVGMNENFYAYYLADFSMGKTSRLLIGSLVNLLTDSPNRKWINCFAGIVLTVVFAFTAILVGRIIKLSDKEIRPVITVFSLFFVSGTFTFWGYSRFFGLLDIYMYVLTVLSLIVVRKRMFKWLVPLLGILGVLINYVYTISYFPVVALALLYLIVTQKNKVGNATVLTVSCITVIFLMFYCTFIGKNSATVTFDEMKSIMEQKFGEKIEYEKISYYDFYLFGSDPVEAEYGADLSELPPVEFIKALLWYLYTQCGYRMTDFLSVILGVLPILGFFWFVWIKCIKLSKKASEKFVYLCFAAAPLFAVICCLLSTDITRWAATGVMTQFGLGYFMFITNDKCFKEVMLQIKARLKGKAMYVATIWIFYASCTEIFELIG